MKASESNKHYASKVRECSNFAAREIKKVCKDIGPRPAGSETENKAQDSVSALMTPFVDEVKVQDFSVKTTPVKPLLIMGIVLAFTAVVFSALSMFDVLPSTVGTAVSSVLCLLAFGIEVYTLGGGRIFKASFSPKGQSKNVICVRKASGEVKRRIVLGGHIDSSYEITKGEKAPMSVSVCIIAPLIIFVAVMQNFLLKGVFTETVGTVINIIDILIECAGALMLISSLKIVNTKVSCQGASNGLTGVYTSMAVLKYLNDNDIRFDNTEVTAVSLGGGFSGSAGANALSVDNSVETVFIGVDTLSDFDNLRVSLDSMASSLVAEGGKLSDCTVKAEGSKFDVTEGAVLNKKGVKSAYLTACAPKQVLNFRTSADTAEKLNMKAVEAGLKIMLETVFLFDEQGLRDKY